MKQFPSRTAWAVVACAALLLAGLVAITPAGASMQRQVATAASTNWNKIWKTKIRPKTDKRYEKKGTAYSEAESDAKYATKVDSDAKYATKADSDAKYALKTKVVRGTYMVSENGPAASDVYGSISFGVNLPAPPTVHYIPSGTAPPYGCSGTIEAPDALPGNLCVFESLNANVGPRVLYRVFPIAPNAASTMGAWIVSNLVAAGNGFYGGTWVVRFDTASSVASAPAPSGVNQFD